MQSRTNSCPPAADSPRVASSAHSCCCPAVLLSLSWGRGLTSHPSSLRVHLGVQNDSAVTSVVLGRGPFLFFLGMIVYGVLVVGSIKAHFYRASSSSRGVCLTCGPNPRGRGVIHSPLTPAVAGLDWWTADCRFPRPACTGLQIQSQQSPPSN